MRRVTPANVLPTLVAFVLAGVLGIPGGGIPGGGIPGGGIPGGASSIALTGPLRTGLSVSARAHATATQATQATQATRAGSQARTEAPADRASMATDPLPVAHTGNTNGHAGPGAALATLSFRLSLDRLRHLLAISASGHPAGITFSSFRSRAPPRPSW